MANDAQVRVGIDFDVNESSLSAISSIKKELDLIQHLEPVDIVNAKSLAETEQELKEAQRAAKQLGDILDSSFNKNLGTLNVSKFSKSLQTLTHGDLSSLYRKLQGAGEVGTAAFNQMARQVLLTNSYIKQSDKILSKVFETLGNTVKWNISSSLINSISGSIQEAWGYTKALDSSLNDIQIVTGKSSDEMAKFAVKANDAAKALSTTTTTYTKAALTFYQQGLGDEDVQARAALSTKVSNVTGLSGDQSSEYVTAVLNGYKVSAEEAEAAMDKLAAVGANTASSLAELSEGMAKVASSANAMGVSEDQLAATLSTVISVTRQDASSVGTAFKTIYARISDIKAGTADAEISLGNYTKKMAEMGFNVLDSTGNLRDLGEVIEEIGGNWKSLSKEQQVSLAQTMAGTRQYNNLIALFDNWSQYEDALNVSMHANGTLQKQQETYATSLAAKLDKLTAAKEHLFSAMIDSDGIKDMLDGLTNVVDKFADFTEAIGGGKTLLLAFGSLFTQIFNKQISASITTLIQNIAGLGTNLSNIQGKMQFKNQLASIGNSETIQHLVGSYSKLEKYLPSMTAEQQKQVFAVTEEANKAVELAENMKKADEEAKNLLKTELKLDATKNDKNEYSYTKNGQNVDVKQEIKNKYDKVRSGTTTYFDRFRMDDGTIDLSIQDQVESMLERFKASYGNINEDIDKVIAEFWQAVKGKNQDEIRHAYNEIETAIQEAIDQQQEQVENAYEQTGEGTGVNRTSTEEAGEEALKVPEQIEKGLKGQKVVGTITGITSAFMGLMSAIQQFKSLGSIWYDKDLSTGDKIIQTVMALGGAILGIIPAITSLSQAGLIATASLGPIIGIVGAIAAVGAIASIVMGGLAKEREREANAAKRQAEADKEALTQLQEEKNSIDDLVSSYENLHNQLKDNQISDEEMQKQSAELLRQYGLEAEALDVLAGKYVDVENAIKEKQKAENDEVIRQADKTIQSAARSTSRELWSNMSSSERDKSKFTDEQGRTFKAKSVDVGSQNNIDEIAGIIKEFGLVTNGTGHITLDSLQAAIETDAAGLKEALEENGSETAEHLLSLLESTDGFQTAIETQTERLVAAIEDINNSDAVPKEGEIQTKEQYDAAIANLAQKYIDEGMDSDEATKEATKVISQIDETTRRFAALEQTMSSTNGVISDSKVQQRWEIAENNAKSATSTEIYSMGDYDKMIAAVMKENQGMSYQEALQFIGEGKAENVKDADGMILTDDAAAEFRQYAKDMYNLSESHLFEGNKNSSKDVQNFRNTMSSEDSQSYQRLKLQASGVSDELLSGDNNILDRAVHDLNDTDYTYFLQLMDEFPTLLLDAGGDVSKAMALIKDRILELKEANKGVIGKETATGAKEVLSYAPGVLNKDNIDTIEGYSKITDNEETMVSLDPGLKDDYAIIKGEVNDIAIGSEEWQKAVGEVQQKAAAMSTVNGIFSKENAQELGLTMRGLEDALNDGVISEQEFEEKLAGTMEAEAEALGISTQELNNYIKGLQDVSENLAEDEQMAKRVAIANKTLESNLKKLTKVFEDQADALKKPNTVEYAAALEEVHDAVDELFGYDVSDDFIAEHLNEIKKLADGDLEVFDELAKAAANDVLVDIKANIDDEEVISELDGIQDLINATDLENLEVGTSLDTTGLDEGLQEMLDWGVMTVDQVEEVLSKLGFTPEVEYEKVSMDSASVDIQDSTFTYTDPVTGKQYKGDVSSHIRAGEEGTLYIPIINGSKTTFNGPPKATTGAGKKKGGGGGGGGGSKPKTVDPVKDEPDRYHDVNVALGKVEKNLSAIEKQQKKLIGKALLDSLNKELSLLQGQVNLHKQKLDIQRQEQKELQEKLSKSGVKFGEDGSISNYNNALVEQENALNAYIDKYNHMTAEEQEANEEELKKMQENYAEFKKNLERYDALVEEEIPNESELIQEALDKMIEINIKKFDLSLSIRVDLQDALKQWNTFKRKVIDGFDDDDIFGQATEDFANLLQLFDQGSGMGVIQETMNKVKETTAEIKKMENGEKSEIFGDDMSSALNYLQEKNTQLQNYLIESKDLLKAIQEGQIKTAQEVVKNLQKQQKLYEVIGKQIEHDMAIIEAVYGEDSHEALAKQYDKKYENDLAQVDYNKRQADMWKEQMEKVNPLDNPKLFEEYENNYYEALDRMHEYEIETINDAKKAREESIKAEFQSIEMDLTDGMGFELMGEEWELINQDANAYLDTVNSTYEVQKLQNKYLKSMKETTSVSAQKKLNDLMEEQIKMLEEKDRLSEYDIERANMKYELALKEIALEEAQQNKSNMRLRRDSQGNYSYQFVADDSQTADLEQDVADAKNSLYNLDKEKYRSDLEEIFNLYKEYAEKMASIKPNDKNAIKVLTDQYTNLINSKLKDNGHLRDNVTESLFGSLSDMYQRNYDSFATMTGLQTAAWDTMTQGELDDITGKMVPIWNGAIQTMTTKMIGNGGLVPTCQSAFVVMADSTSIYTSRLDEVQQASGETFEDIKNGIDSVITEVQTLINNNQDLINSEKEVMTQYDLVAENAKKVIEAFKGITDTAVQAAEDANTLYTTLMDKEAKLTAGKTAVDNYTTSLDNLIKKLDEYSKVKQPDTSGGNGGSSSLGGGVISGGDIPADPPKTVNLPKYLAFSKQMVGNKVTGYVYYGNYSSRSAAVEALSRDFKIKSDRQHVHESKSGNVGVQGKYYANLSAFKSGGYTGSWYGGSDEANGRLAFLHQKELVLNERDTQNLLDTVQILRDKINGVSPMEAVSDMIASRLEELNARYNNTLSQSLNNEEIIQNIHIEANFPDTNSTAAIEEAFLNLANRASQYAHRNRR